MPVATGKPAHIVNCPNCGKSAKWTPKNPFRPFCSERCKLIDLGAWASGGRVISGSEAEGAMSGEGEAHRSVPPSPSV